MPAVGSTYTSLCQGPHPLLGQQDFTVQGGYGQTAGPGEPCLAGSLVGLDVRASGLKEAVSVWVPEGRSHDGPRRGLFPSSSYPHLPKAGRSQEGQLDPQSQNMSTSCQVPSPFSYDDDPWESAEGHVY